MSHVGIRFGSHLPCQELEAAEFLTSWDTPTAGLGYVLEMRQKVGNCSKSRFSTVKSGFQQKTAHNQVLSRPSSRFFLGYGFARYIYMVGNYLRAAAPAADPGRIGKEAKQIGIKTLRCFAPWGFRPFSYVYCCEIYLIGLNFHL